MAETIDIGEFNKSETTKVIVKINEFQGEKGVDIREYVETKKYTGPTKKGVRVPMSKWDEFTRIINEIKF